nr:unnamed protein product [Callosobruchus analis]
MQIIIFCSVDVGRQERISDGGVFQSSELYKKLQANSLGFPKARSLPGRQKEVPYCIKRDLSEEFSITDYVEHGEWSKASLKEAEVIVMAVAHLHNFLRRSSTSVILYTPPGTFDYEIDGRVVEGN